MESNTVIEVIIPFITLKTVSCDAANWAADFRNKWVFDTYKKIHYMKGFILFIIWLDLSKCIVSNIQEDK